MEGQESKSRKRQREEEILISEGSKFLKEIKNKLFFLITPIASLTPIFKQPPLKEVNIRNATYENQLYEKNSILTPREIYAIDKKLEENGCPIPKREHFLLLYVTAFLTSEITYNNRNNPAESIRGLLVAFTKFLVSCDAGFNEPEIKRNIANLRLALSVFIDLDDESDISETVDDFVTSITESNILVSHSANKLILKAHGYDVDSKEVYIERFLDLCMSILAFINWLHLHSFTTELTGFFPWQLLIGNYIFTLFYTVFRLVEENGNSHFLSKYLTSACNLFLIQYLRLFTPGEFNYGALSLVLPDDPRLAGVCLGNLVLYMIGEINYVATIRVFGSLEIKDLKSAFVVILNSMVLYFLDVNSLDFKISQFYTNQDTIIQILNSYDRLTLEDENNEWLSMQKRYFETYNPSIVSVGLLATSGIYGYRAFSQVPLSLSQSVSITQYITATIIYDQVNLVEFNPVMARDSLTDACKVLTDSILLIEDKSKWQTSVETVANLTNQALSVLQKLKGVFMPGTQALKPGDDTEVKKVKPILKPPPKVVVKLENLETDPSTEEFKLFLEKVNLECKKIQNGETKDRFVFAKFLRQKRDLKRGLQSKSTSLTDQEKIDEFLKVLKDLEDFAFAYAELSSYSFSDYLDYLFRLDPRRGYVLKESRDRGVKNRAYITEFSREFVLVYKSDQLSYVLENIKKIPLLGDFARFLEMNLYFMLATSAVTLLTQISKLIPFDKKKSYVPLNAAPLIFEVLKPEIQKSFFLLYAFGTRIHDIRLLLSLENKEEMEKLPSLVLYRLKQFGKITAEDWKGLKRNVTRRTRYNTVYTKEEKLEDAITEQDFYSLALAKKNFNWKSSFF